MGTGPFFSRYSAAALRGAALYLGFSLLWILFSDRLILGFSRDPAVLTTAQTFKGLVFVAMTAALIAFLLEREVRRMRSSEEAAREKNEETERYFSLSLDLLCIATISGSFVRLNPEWTKVLGYEEADLIGRNFLELVHPDDVEATRAAVSRLDRQEEVLNFVNRYRRADGTYRWIEWRSRAQGAVIYATARDITERKLAEEALIRKDALLRAMLRNLPFDCWARDTSQRIIMQSDESILLWGDLATDTTTGREFDQETAARWQRNNARVLAGETISEEYASVSRSGERRQYHQIVAPIREGETILGILGINIDITAHKRALEDVRTSNELLSAFIRHSPIYAFIKEVDATVSRTLMASDNFEEMVGIPGSAMIGKTMAELFPAEFAAKITADDWLVVSRAEVLRLEEELNGRSYTTIKFPLALGGRNYLAGYTIDLTERKQAEQALRDSETTFRNIVQASPMGVHLYRLEEDDRLVFAGANPAADRLLGLDNTRFVGMTIEEAFPPLIGTEIPMRYRRAARVGESWFTEQFQYDHGAISGAYEVHAFQMSPGRMAVLFNDITSRKQAEEERERLQSQLVQAQKMESVGRLAGGVAHDFNNMLGVILGQAELALQRIEPGHPLAASLGDIRAAAERSAELTRQLLAFARKQTVAPRVLDLNETVEGLLGMLRRLIGEDIALAWLPGGNPVPVRMDPSQIDQILVNLCVNARDAIGNTGTVTIETSSVILDAHFCAEHPGAVAGSFALLTVSDSGCGMAGETLSHLFEPFYTTKETGKGTGLGLATVYGIVKQNDGFITVESAPGKGTTFRIYLPRHAAPVGPAAALAAPAVPGGSETILLVEDEPLVLEMTGAMLDGLGYTVLAASGPGEALRLAGEHAGEVHLLMTDVVMPEMNGRDLAEELQQRYPHLHCLFMSGYTADVIAHHGVLDSEVRFIQKPFTIRTLAERIREALAAGERQ